MVSARGGTLQVDVPGLSQLDVLRGSTNIGTLYPTFGMYPSREVVLNWEILDPKIGVT